MSRIVGGEVTLRSSRIRAKLHYTDTGYEHRLRTPSTNELTTIILQLVVQQSHHQPTKICHTCRDVGLRHCDVANLLLTGNSPNEALPRGGSRKKYLGGLAPHHLGGNNGYAKFKWNYTIEPINSTSSRTTVSKNLRGRARFGGRLPPWPQRRTATGFTRGSWLGLIGPEA